MKSLSHQKLLGGLDRKLASSKLPLDQFGRIRSALRVVPNADSFLLNFHGLIAKLGSAQKTRLAKKIIGDAKTVKVALGLERAAQKVARVLAGSKAAQPSQVWTLLSGQPLPLLLFLLVNFRQAKVQIRVKNFLLKYPQVRARMPRAELQTLGLEPCAKFEKIVHQLFLDELDGKIKTHQQLLKAFRALAGIKEPEVKPPARPAPPAKKKTEKGKAKK